MRVATKHHCQWREDNGATAPKHRPLYQTYPRCLHLPYPLLIRAPKRDHDEWLVRGRSGGPGVVPVQVDPTGGRSLILGI